MVDFQEYGFGNGSIVNKDNKKFCLYHFTFIDECIDTSCPLYPCKFADIHKSMTKMFKDKGMSTNDARRVARGVLLRVYRPTIPVSKDKTKNVLTRDHDIFGFKL